MTRTQVTRPGGLPFTQASVAIVNDNRLSRDARLLYVVLTTFASTSGDRAVWPSDSTIAERLGVTRKTAWTYRRELEAAGVITVTHRTTANGMQTSNLIVLNDVQVPPHAVSPTTHPVCSPLHSGCVTYYTGGVSPTTHELEPIELEPIELEPVKKNKDLAPEIAADHLDIETGSTVVERTPKTRRTVSTDPDFDRFWALYPRKAAKPAAAKAWAKALERTSAETILGSLHSHVDAWATDDPKFTPHPATWLNRDGWEDTPVAAPQHRGPVLTRSQEATAATFAAMRRRAAELDARDASVATAAIAGSLS